MVIWTEHAKTQLAHIHEHIAQDSPLYATKVAQTLVEKSLRLAELPRLGRKVPEAGDEAIRELSVYSYRVIYEIRAAHIEVLAVVHKRRDLQADELREKE